MFVGFSKATLSLICYGIYTCKHKSILGAACTEGGLGCTTSNFRKNLHEPMVFDMKIPSSQCKANFLYMIPILQYETEQSDIDGGLSPSSSCQMVVFWDACRYLKKLLKNLENFSFVECLNHQCISFPPPVRIIKFSLSLPSHILVAWFCFPSHAPKPWFPFLSPHPTFN